MLYLGKIVAIGRHKHNTTKFINILTPDNFQTFEGIYIQIITYLTLSKNTLQAVGHNYL